MSQTSKYLLLLVGPSCGGKSHLLNHLVTNYPEDFGRLISYTTRGRRPGEEELEYNFITEDEFAAVKDDLCQFVHYKGTYYGTSKVELKRVLDSGKTPIRIVEPSGVEQFVKALKGENIEVLTVYVDAPREVLLMRWIDRYIKKSIEVENEGHPEFDARPMMSRILETLYVEVNWINGQPYHFYFDEYLRDFASMVHQIRRIATGNIPKDLICRLSPRPFP